MEDPLNPKIVYTDAAFPVYDASNEDLRRLLLKYDQEAAVKIHEDGDFSFDFLDERDRVRIKKGEIGHNSPHVNGFPVTYKEGDIVRARDDRVGTVLGSHWF